MESARLQADASVPKASLTLLGALGAAAATATSPGDGVLVVAAFGALLCSVWATLWPARWVFVLLAAKPLIDLTWRWQFFSVLGQEVNIQSLVGIFVIGFTALGVLTRWRRTHVGALYWLFVLSAGLSVLMQPSSQGVNELIRLYAGASFFVSAGYVLHNRATFDRFTHVFLVTASVPVLLSFGQLAAVLPYEYWDFLDGVRRGRVSGTYQHPLGIIYFLMYAVPLALYTARAKGQHVGPRLLGIAFLVASFGALVFTYHRTGLITIVLMIPLWLSLTGRRTLAIAIVGLGALVALAFADWVVLIFGNLFDVLRGQVDLSDPDFLRGRGTNFYLFISSYLTGGPLVWAFGRGASIAEGVVPVFGLFVANEPHNDFIRVLHAYGLVGLALYVGLLWSFVRKAWRLRILGGDFEHDVGSIMIVMVFGVVMLSITGEPLRYPTGVWYLFAFGATVWRLHADLAATPHPSRGGPLWPAR